MTALPDLPAFRSATDLPSGHGDASGAAGAPDADPPADDDVPADAPGLAVAAPLPDAAGIGELVCPLPADADQRRAVLALARGRSFALLGDVGSGKRQTIANLVAQGLAGRRRMLVVGAAQASLDALGWKLAEAGIDQFVLPLHGRHGRAPTLHARLRAAWLGGVAGLPARHARDVEQHAALGAGFDALVARLHTPHACGLTLHEAIARVLAAPAAEPVDPAAVPVLACTAPDDIDAARLAGLRALAVRLGERAGRAGVGANAATPDDTLLDLIGHARWSVEWQLGLDQAAAALRAAIDTAANAVQDWRRAVDLPALGLDAATRRGLRLLAETLANPPAGIDARLALAPGAAVLCARLDAALALLDRHACCRAALPAPWTEPVMRAARAGLDLLAEEDRRLRGLGPVWPERTLDQLGQGADQLARWRELRARLSARYRPEVARLDLAALAAEWVRAGEAAWPMRGLRRKRVADQLRPWIEGDATPDTGADLALLAEIARLEPAIATLDRLRLPDGPWRGFDTDLAVLGASFVFQQRLAELHAGGDWNHDGLDCVADGRAGRDLAEQYRRVRELLQLRGAIADLDGYDNLGNLTGGLWAGRATDRPRLRAALALHALLAGVTNGLPLAPAWETGLTLEIRLAAPATSAEDDPLARLVAALRALAACERELAAPASFDAALPGIWQGGATDGARLAQAAEHLRALDRVCRDLGGGPARQDDVRRRLDGFFARIAADPAGGLVAIAPARVGHLVAEAALDGALDAFLACAGSAPDVHERLAAHGLPALLGLLQRLPAVAPRLPAWCDWREARAEALDAGLAPLVEALEAGRFAPDATAAVFEQAWLRGWVDAVIAADPLLRDFDANAHEAARRDYRALDDRLRLAARERVRVALRAETVLPGYDAVGSVVAQDLASVSGIAAQWLLIRREIERGLATADGLPTGAAPLEIAALLADAGEALLRLTPCLLATPDALDGALPASIVFDVVIADASDGLAPATLDALAGRARQFVLVGAATAGLPVIRLGSHHRSRDPALLAFSRARGRIGAQWLLPAPTGANDARQWHRLAPGLDADGVARAVARSLCTQLRLAAVAAEADAVTAVAFGGDAVVAPRRASFGAIATDAGLRAALDAALAAERAADPALDAFFADDQPEPLVVRDLADLARGDARDVIYLVARDPVPEEACDGLPGDMAVARLHLALTRARATLHVFAPAPGGMQMRATQVGERLVPALRNGEPEAGRAGTPDGAAGACGRTSGAELSAELRLLFDDLEWAAEAGALAATAAMSTATTAANGTVTDGLAVAVSAALSGRGWQVGQGSGQGDARCGVPLVVADPERPWSELAAVEYDMPGLDRLAAVDRELAREATLRDLGWDVLRVAVLDAWRDPVALGARLDDELRLLLSRRRRARGAMEMTPPRAAASVLPSAPAPGGKPASESKPAVPVIAAPVEETVAEPIAELIAEPEVASPVMTAGVTPARAATAVTVDPPSAAALDEGIALTDDSATEHALVDDTPMECGDIIGPFAAAPTASETGDPEASVPCARVVPSASESPEPEPEHVLGLRSVADPHGFRAVDRVSLALALGRAPAEVVDDDQQLRAMALHVVGREGPVREDVVARRIARACGQSDDGGSLLARIRVLLADRPVTFEGSRVFVWPGRGGIDRFRHPGDARPLDEIAHAELAALAREIDAAGANDPVAAVAAMARACGLDEPDAVARDRLELAWLARGHRPN
ncbi:DUF3320 domain-containing protein [Derxia gummosa]|uniref:DUF3320 domain-containing protein n=1 Tax=Derxia gummosa DSM 723 TaxID=1121388 RepID=A0A8B6X162_9BURK|nr:DUF3320 domain-containing protein [Derxia gummosa]